MNEYLPSITVQKGFFTNNFYNHKRFFSFGDNKKNLNKNHPNYINKQNSNNLINDNNFLIVSNTYKDEVNSNKNTTAISYYNKGFSDAKLNKNNKNNAISKTIYKYQNKDLTKNQLNKYLLKSYNNINNKIIQEMNINKNTNLRNFQLFLPEVQSDNKFIRLHKGNSLYVSNKENNPNNIVNSSNKKNQIKNMNKINNNNPNKSELNQEKTYFRNINLLKEKEPLTAIGFLDNQNNKYTILKNKNFSNYSSRRISNNELNIEKIKQKEKKNLIALNMNMNKKKIKSFSNINNKNTDLNKNLNNITDNLVIQNKNKNSKTRICPLCHKEKDIYKYKYHISLHPSKILDWLYLGSYRNACDKQEIKDLGINYVLNCAIECNETLPPGVKYCHLKLSDTPNFRIIKYLDKATAFIDQAQSNNGIILVHCQLGISRSTSCVIAYFIKYLGYTALGALDFIKKKRTQVMPNFGFLNQLMVYEKNNLSNEKK